MRITLKLLAILTLGAVHPATAQDEFSQPRVLFDADSRIFIQQSEDFTFVLGAAPITNWQAEGLSADDALDLTTLLANPSSLSAEDAERLEGITFSAEIVIPAPFEPIALPEVGGGTPVVGIGILPRRAPTCPDGRELPDFCVGQIDNGSRLCSCD